MKKWLALLCAVLLPALALGEATPTPTLPMDFTPGHVADPANYTENGYEDETLSVTMERVWVGDAQFNLARVKIADPSQLRISDLSQTEGCPLARVVRKELRARGILHHRVLWSPELPRKAEQHEAPPPGRRSVPGSVAWVPPVAGLMMAGDVILSLAQV